MDELVSEFGDRIQIEYRLFPVFGDALGKIDSQWRDRGGRKGYSEHVLKVAAQFDHVAVSPDVWLKGAPASSLPAHLYLCAIRLAEQHQRVPDGSIVAATRSLRTAFFADNLNIAERGCLRQQLAAQGLPLAALDAAVDSGQAYAALTADMQLAKDLVVRSSPTLIFNEDRQRLAGNVGYRIIEANIRELIERPAAQHSWC